MNKKEYWINFSALALVLFLFLFGAVVLVYVVWVDPPTVPPRDSRPVNVIIE